MRQLKTNDVFKMSRILEKLELKNIEFDKTSENADEQFAITLLFKIAENAHMAQNEINDFMGDLCGMKGEDFGELPITEALKYIEEFKNLDGVASFFKYAGQLTK